MLVQRGYESDPVKAWKEAQEKVIICRMRHSEKLLKATSKANQKPNPWILNLVLLTVLSGVFGDWSLLFIHETDMVQELAVHTHHKAHGQCGSAWASTVAPGLRR